MTKRNDMESKAQFIQGLKTTINNVPLRQEGCKIIYEFCFTETMSRVKITLDDGKEVIYPVNIIYTNVFQIQIQGKLYTISSFIQDGQLRISLNNGEVILLHYQI